MVQAGLKAIYVSGWQVAGDMNTAGQTYPDQSLYPVDSVPSLVRRINNALQRADEITQNAGLADRMPQWHVPLVADAEAGFGGVLNAFELMKAMIEAGAAAVHFEDQLSSSKKCGHMGGKVLVPTQEAIAKLVAARLAADVLGCADLDRRPHRCPGGEAAHQRYRRRRPAGFSRGTAPWKVSTWCATASIRPSPGDWPTPPMPTWCGARPRHPIWRRRGSSPRRSTPATRGSCWPTIARPRSTGNNCLATSKSPRSSATWPAWATSSSSSPWPASMP